MTLRDDIRGYFDGEESRHPVPAGLRDSVLAEAANSDLTPRRGLNLAAGFWGYELAVVEDPDGNRLWFPKPG